MQLNDFYGKYSEKFEKSQIFSQNFNDKNRSDRKVVTSQALKRLPIVFKEVTYSKNHNSFFFSHQLNEANEKLKKYTKIYVKENSKSNQG